MCQEVSSSWIDSLIMEKYKSDPEDLIHILQEINGEYNYIPRESIVMVADRLEIPVSQVYSVATYYKAFNLEPRGKNLISVCTGTACHVRGAEKIIEKLERDLEVSSGGTSADKKFSLETVRCIGCCSLGPVMTVNHDTHGRLKLDSLPKILKNYE